MVVASMSYMLCGTPRTGSTLLCSLLSATGVAGRPESYFREQDQQMWAERFGVPVLRDGLSDYPQFVAGAVRFGSTPNGVFAARIMWGTMPLLVEGLDPHRGTPTDVQVLTDTLGPLRFVHLRRNDVVGQAVSWARAEQTGFWQHGDVPSAEPRFDRGQIDELVDTIDEHNAAWRAWFIDQGVEPVEVTYEAVVARPSDAVNVVLDAIGAQVPDGWTPAPPHRKQADAVNVDWLQRYHAE
jgi:LPS sulfotransferase NodH